MGQYSTTPPLQEPLEHEYFSTVYNPSPSSGHGSAVLSPILIIWHPQMAQTDGGGIGFLHGKYIPPFNVILDEIIMPVNLVYDKPDYHKKRPLFRPFGYSSLFFSISFQSCRSAGRHILQSGVSFPALSCSNRHSSGCPNKDRIRLFPSRSDAIPPAR